LGVPAPVKPPRDEAELRGRAARLAGCTLGEIAERLGLAGPGGGVGRKGKVGELLERVLGATAGSRQQPDFVHLGIELKTIPIDARGKPLESTFVCAISLGDADAAEWETSPARAKLSHVLWLPVVGDRSLEPDARRVGAPVFWRPTADQEEILRADFEDIMGLIGAGHVEALTARRGRWMQVRPKAATGRVRTTSFGPEGERISTVPRGFYLRSRFTEALLRDPAASPP
jgi:DNA mismatch repair protein MutH